MVRYNVEKLLEHPIAQALKPVGRSFMRAHWLSDKLNPGAPHGLKVAAVTPFPEFGHLKIPPAFRMMVEDYENGLYEGMHTLIVPSSGNTAFGAARLAPVFGFTRTKVVIPSDTPPIKRLVLEETPWTEVLPAGGAGRSSAEIVAEHAQLSGHYVLDQYTHMGNLRAHELYTGPQIRHACRGFLDIIVISMGSGGTVGGVGKYLKEVRPGTIVIGARPILGEQVPGTRDERRMAEVVTLPWQEYVDVVMEGGRKDAFITMRQLASELEPAPGPSSALALNCLGDWIRKLDPHAREQLREKHAAFVCPDQSWPYAERATAELDPGQGMIR